jgi:membrane protein implicated in regulation of membrane protease activity
VLIHFWVDFSSWLQAGSSALTAEVTFGDIFITVVGSALAIGYGSLLLFLAHRRQTRSVEQKP